MTEQPGKGEETDGGLPTIRQDGIVAYLKSWKVPLLGLLAFGGVVAAIIGVTSYWTSGSEERDAISHCESAVKNRLRSPSTAVFPDTSAHEGGEYVYNDIPARYREMENVTTWVVTGPVDAQNGFGATIRNKFNCRAIFSDGMFAGTEIGYIE
ncbi:hypothetical protein [Rhodococcus spongiicola]|uniref:Uncharacterized protein n=1 Tax=Rhodococcus spongiicola TaxID=2487352 RepID=A0A3S3BMP3_9NOCA|nr:hypothetical protein [Rhodococcus spongiicola]RVW04880.1 hypothetical protein EF834_07805 [Rhodococcus spongiicola]